MRKLTEVVADLQSARQHVKDLEADWLEIKRHEHREAIRRHKWLYYGPTQAAALWRKG